MVPLSLEVWRLHHRCRSDSGASLSYARSANIRIICIFGPPGRFGRCDLFGAPVAQTADTPLPLSATEREPELTFVPPGPFERISVQHLAVRVGGRCQLALP